MGQRCTRVFFGFVQRQPTDHPIDNDASVRGANFVDQKPGGPRRVRTHASVSETVFVDQQPGGPRRPRTNASVREAIFVDREPVGPRRVRASAFVGGILSSNDNQWLRAACATTGLLRTSVKRVGQLLNNGTSRRVQLLG